MVLMLLCIGVVLVLFLLSMVLVIGVLCFVVDFYFSIYQVYFDVLVLIQNVIVLIGIGQCLDNVDVLLCEGCIVVVDCQLQVDVGVICFNVQGKWVILGLIDVYLYLGVYFSLGVGVYSDGNEMIVLVIVNVWVEYLVWLQDLGFVIVLVGGVISMQVLLGLVNLVGGRGVILKNVFVIIYQVMKFFGVLWGLKMVCGENLKWVYGGGKGVVLVMWMGNVVGYCVVFIDVVDYIVKNKLKLVKCKGWFGSDKGDSVGDVGGKCDFKLDMLVGVIEGDICVYIYCYCVDEMVIMFDLVKEFGFKVVVFYYGVEVYKLVDWLVVDGVCGVLWVDWWGFKMEVFDGILENIVLVDWLKNSCVIVYFDLFEGIQCLNQEVVKVIVVVCCVYMLEIIFEYVIIWMIVNVVRVLGIEGQIGILEVGKMVDVVVWNGNFFSLYVLVEQVFIDGCCLYDRGVFVVMFCFDFQFGQEVY